MPPRYRTKAKTNLSYNELQEENKRLQFTADSRNRRIQALYHVVKTLSENNPACVPVQDGVELREQLSQARQALIATQALLGGAEVTTTTTRDNAFDCVVCYLEFDDEARQPVSLPCGHILCTACCVAIQNIKPCCPKCRLVYTKFLPLFF